MRKLKDLVGGVGGFLWNGFAITGIVIVGLMVMLMLVVEDYEVGVSTEPIELTEVLVEVDFIGRIWPVARRVLDKLRVHESVNGTKMEGDGGLARGWFHHHKSNWDEGAKYLGVSWKWETDSLVLWKAEHIVVSMWHKNSYAALTEGNEEILVRSFRLPSDPWREDNDEYVRKVLSD